METMYLFKSTKLLKETDHVYLRHLSTECRSILSADMATNTRPICRPSVGRVSVDMNRQACRPTPGRYFTAPRPPPGRYFTNTRPTLSSLGQLLLTSVLSSLLYWERLSVAVVLFWPLTPAIFMSFFSYVYSSSSLLYTTLVTFGCSSIWGLLLLEARYYRGAKDDIKSW